MKQYKNDFSNVTTKTKMSHWYYNSNAKTELEILILQVYFTV